MKLAVYYDLARGGGAMALGRFVRFLRRRHEVNVFAAAGAWPITDDTGWIGSVPRSFPLLPDGSYLARLARTAFRHRRTEAERQLARSLEDYPRVLVHSCRDRGAPALLAALGRRAVFYVTEPLRLYREPRPPDTVHPVLWTASRAMLFPVSSAWNRADRRHARAAGRLLANSRYTQRQVGMVYGRKARVVPPSVDPSFLEEPTGSGEGEFVLSPGALFPQKGHGRVLRAMARWPRRPPLVIAGFAGQTGFRKRLEKTAARLGVSTEIRTDLSAIQMRELFRAARLVAVAAWKEPFGLVALEAQAAGRPLVVADEGGLPETVIPGETAVTASPEPEPLADALRRLWDDRSRAERFARAGRHYVRTTFHPVVCGERLERELLEPDGGASGSSEGVSS